MCNNQPYGIPGYNFRPQMYQNPAAMQQNPAFQQMSVTPVTGMAQVDAAQAPFDGTPMFFYDTAADALYIKQFDARNGTAPVTVYRKEVQAAPPQYATVEQLTALEQRITAMLTPAEETKTRKARKEADTE